MPYPAVQPYPIDATALYKQAPPSSADLAAAGFERWDRLPSLAELRHASQRGLLPEARAPDRQQPGTDVNAECIWHTACSADTALSERQNQVLKVLMVALGQLDAECSRVHYALFTLMKMHV